MSQNCFHCDLPVPPGSHFTAEIFGDEQAFCCAGCQAIAETLVAEGLDQYYKFRTQPGLKPKSLLPEELQQLEALDSEKIIAQIATSNDEVYSTIQLSLEGVSCAACAWLIQKELGKLDVVKTINVDVTSQTASLTWKKDFPLADIVKRLARLGYKASPWTEDSNLHRFKEEQKNFIKRLLVSGLGMMQVMMFSVGIYIGEFQDISQSHQFFLYWVSALVALPVVTYAAYPFHVSAIRNLKHGRLGMNFPVSLAITLAYLVSLYSLLSHQATVYFDSVVMFTFFLLLGRFAEHRARFVASKKQQNFQQLLPLSASRLPNTTSESHPQAKYDSHEIVAVGELSAGDRIIIVAGGIIPVDGILNSSQTLVDESIMTGEFAKIKKLKGDALISGSTNVGGAIEMQVTRPLSESHFSQLIKLQQNALQCRPSSVILADKIAHYYVIGLLTIALLTTYWWWLHDFEHLIPTLLSVLIVSCPCALSLATPAAHAAVTSRLSELGLILRNPDTVEKLNRIEVVYFDKTGTLTNEDISLELITTKHLNHAEALWLAREIEKISTHPIADWFKNLDQEQLSKPDNIEVISSEEVIAAGVKARIQWDKQTLDVRFGGKEFCRELNPNFSVEDIADSEALFLCSDDKLLAIFKLSDQVNAEAAPLIEWLGSRGIECVMLTGDNSDRAVQLAKKVGIKPSAVFANCKPEDKLRIVRESRKKSLMVGDGFNDVGALAAADVSLTLGRRSYLSSLSSDATLLSHHLSVIKDWIQLSAKTNSISTQNYFWAIIYNLIAIPFAVAGMVPAWLAAIGMTSSSLIVVLNALRLR